MREKKSNIIKNQLNGKKDTRNLNTNIQSTNQSEVFRKNPLKFQMILIIKSAKNHKLLRKNKVHLNKKNHKKIYRKAYRNPTKHKKNLKKVAKSL